MGRRAKLTNIGGKHIERKEIDGSFNVVGF
jgi:hypothetical protein